MVGTDTRGEHLGIEGERVEMGAEAEGVGSNEGVVGEQSGRSGEAAEEDGGVVEGGGGRGGGGGGEEEAGQDSCGGIVAERRASDDDSGVDLLELSKAVTAVDEAGEGGREREGVRVPAHPMSHSTPCPRITILSPLLYNYLIQNAIDLLFIEEDILLFVR